MKTMIFMAVFGFALAACGINVVEHPVKALTLILIVGIGMTIIK